MFRRELPEGRGMLFDFKQDSRSSLDEEHLHLARHDLHPGDGRILRIAENTEPLRKR